MAQRPPRPTTPQEPSGFYTRAMPEVRNPVYAYDMTDNFKSPQPTNVLERPPQRRRGVEDRLTAQGSHPPVAGLTPIVPAAYQTPYNVWALYPQ